LAIATCPSAAARTIIVMVWLPELPPMRDQLLDRAFEQADHARCDERGDEVDGEPCPAVAEGCPDRRENVLLFAQAGLREEILLATLPDEVEHLVDRHATDQPVVGVEDGSRHEVVALERGGRHVGLLVLAQQHGRRLHDRLDHRLRVRDDQLVDRQHAEQSVVAVDDEHLVGLRRQFVEAAQVAQHHFERHVRPDRDVLEVHQRADHVVGEGHRRP